MIPSKRLQVFVSSTYKDLIEERQAAVQAILSNGHIPAGMELFSAGDESQMTVIKHWIEQSDVYLLILGGCYGSIEPTSGKSYTQLEYEYALSLGKPLFSIVITEDHLEEKVRKEGTKVMETNNPALLKEFRSLVLSKMVRFWSDAKDIKLSVFETLSEFARREDLVGWVPGDKKIDTSGLAEELARLGRENAALRKQLDEAGTLSQLDFNGLSYQELKKLLDSLKFDMTNINFTKQLAEEIGAQSENFGASNNNISFLHFFYVLANFNNVFDYMPFERAIAHFKRLQQLGLIRNSGTVSITDVGRNFTNRIFYEIETGLL
ncbi:DUF4062 domain-containing protein [Chitinophagaceae bacterium MMS25-I14]